MRIRPKRGLEWTRDGAFFVHPLAIGPAPLSPVVRLLRALQYQRFIIVMLAMLVLISSVGCVTLEPIRQAKPATTFTDEGEEVEFRPAQSGYYALVPFAVVVDIAASPIYLFGLIIWAPSGWKN